MRFSFKVLKYFLLSRLIVISSALLSVRFIPANNIADTWNVGVPFFNLFARWDSAYYLAIAQGGYDAGATWAFRPLFPLALKTGSIPFAVSMESLTVAGFFLNAVFFLLALFVVHNLTQRLFSEKVADDTVLLLALCPVGIFYTAIYSEPLFLLLVSLSFFFLETERLYRSSIAGYLAGLTRPEGFFVFVAMFFKKFKSKISLGKKALSLLVVFCSLLTIPLLAWVYTGNPLIFFSAEQSWDAANVTLLEAISNPYGTFNQYFLEFWAFSISAVVLGFLVVSQFFVRNRGSILDNKLFPYYAYVLVLLVFYVSIGDIRSMARFVSTLIPVYWGLAVWAGNKKPVKILLLSLFTVQLVVGTVLFSNWYLFI